MSGFLRRKRARARRIRPRPGSWVTVQNRHKIAAEAKALGMSSNEYLRLMLLLSSTFRENLRVNANLRPKELLKLVENPLFSVLLQWLSTNALSSITKQSDEAADRVPVYPSSPAQPQMPRPPMVRNPLPQPSVDRRLHAQSQPVQPWSYW